MSASVPRLNFYERPHLDDYDGVWVVLLYVWARSNGKLRYVMTCNILDQWLDAHEVEREWAKQKMANEWRRNFGPTPKDRYFVVRLSPSRSTR